jgi:hypothetical protein
MAITNVGWPAALVIMGAALSSCGRKQGIDLTDVSPGAVQRALVWSRAGEIAYQRPGEWQSGRQVLEANPPAPADGYQMSADKRCWTRVPSDPIGRLVLGAKVKGCRYKYFRLNAGKLDSLQICHESSSGWEQIQQVGTFSSERSELIETWLTESRRVGGAERSSVKIRMVAQRIGECPATSQLKKM